MSLSADLELGIRTLPLAALLVLVSVFLRDHRRVPLARYGSPIFVCLGSYFVPSAMLATDTPGLGVLLISITQDIGPAVFWSLCCIIYISGFKLGKRHIAAFAVFAIAALVANCPPGVFTKTAADLAFTVTLLMQLAFNGHSIFLIYTRAADDLIDGRRMTRLVITSAVTIMGLYATVGNALYRGTIVSAPLELGMVAFSSVALCLIITQLFRIDQDRTFIAATLGLPVQQPFERQLRPTDSADNDLIDRLNRLMNEEHLYLQPGLSVNDMAKRMEISEHQLRTLINRELGYRNFSTFLNRYRVESACDQLSSVEFARIPILTLAMDLGFSSIGPFNQAFKEVMDTTPSQYRRDSLMMSSEDNQELEKPLSST